MACFLLKLFSKCISHFSSNFINVFSCVFGDVLSSLLGIFYKDAYQHVLVAFKGLFTFCFIILIIFFFFFSLSTLAVYKQVAHFQKSIGHGQIMVGPSVVHIIQWNPREVNTLEVNSRLKSTPHGGPDFFLLCLSNFISLKVNVLGPIFG